jgi:hypothetical protein
MVSSQVWRTGSLFVILSLNVVYVFPETGLGIDPQFGAIVLVLVVAILAAVLFRVLQAQRIAKMSHSHQQGGSTRSARAEDALPAALNALMVADSNFMTFKEALVRAQDVGLAGPLEAAALAKLADLAASELDAAIAGTNLEKLTAITAALATFPPNSSSQDNRLDQRSGLPARMSLEQRESAEAAVACLEALPKGAAACQAAISGPHGARCSPAARAILEQVVSYGDNAKMVPLVEAAARGHAAVVSALLAAGTNPNGADLTGCTALAWAARSGHAVLVACLLARGAAPDAHDRNGVAALDWATQLGHANVVAVLEGHNNFD